MVIWGKQKEGGVSYPVLPVEPDNPPHQNEIKQGKVLFVLQLC